ncbi:MAG: 50S ribosomal protein L24 [Candidatus Woesearchaeota archaeon]
MKEFSRYWKGSKSIRKQRKYRIHAPLNIRRSFLSGHLAKELRTKYGRRSFPLRKGDTVKITKGDFKGKEGKIERLDLKNSKIYVAGIDVTKREGTKSFPAIDPANVLIMQLVLEDKKRVSSMKKSRGKK